VRELNQCGYRAYLDRQDILPSEPWQERLSELIRIADTVVFILSPDAVRSTVCNWEVDEAQRLAKRAIPIIYKETEHSNIPDALRRLNFIYYERQGVENLTPEELLEKTLDQLITALDTDIGWVREHTRIGTLAFKWIELGRPQSDILRGDTLARAEEWLRLAAQKDTPAVDTHRTFIIDSRRLFDQEEAEKRAALERLMVSQSRFFADLSVQQTEAGDAVSGMLLALEGLVDPKSDSAIQRDRPYVSNCERALQLGYSSQREVAVLAHRNWVHGVAFDKASTRIATACYDNVVRVWDLATGKECAVMKGHTNAAMCVAFSPTMRIVASGSQDNTVRIWDVETGRQLAVLEGHDSNVSSLVFNRDGTRIATTSWDKTVRLWDVTEQRSLAVLPHRTDPKILVMSGNGRWIVTTISYDKNAFVWDQQSGAPIGELAGHTSDVCNVAIDVESRFAVTSSFDRTAILWNLNTCASVRSFRGHEGHVNCAALSSDCKRLATASDDMTCRIWDVASGVEIAVLRGHTDQVRYVDFTSDGFRVVTGDKSGIMILWDAAEGTFITSMAGHVDEIFDWTTSFNGSWVATASRDGTCRI
jgi:WD40 repeat protein